MNEVYPTLSTQYADVVLPVAMWVEREGQFGNGERRTAVFEKAVLTRRARPSWDALDAAWKWPNACSTARRSTARTPSTALFGAWYDKDAADFKGDATRGEPQRVGGVPHVLEPQR